MADENTQDPNADLKFSQADVDRIVQNRIKGYSDYNDLKAKVAELPDLQKKVESLTAEVTAGGKALEGVLNNLVTSIPEEKRTLIPEGYSITQRIDWINKNTTHLGIVIKAPEGEDDDNTTTPPPDKAEVKTETKPNTPPPVTTPKVTDTQWGGYATKEEWASKEPKKYLEWRKKNPTTY